MEGKYDTNEREFLAVIWAVMLLRPYLLMTHFIIRSDQYPLKWIFGTNAKGVKLDRWRLRLQEFDFTVEHLPGIKNRVADAMSRLKTQGDDERHQAVDVDIATISGTPTHCVEIPTFSIEKRIASSLWKKK